MRLLRPAFKATHATSKPGVSRKSCPDITIYTGTTNLYHTTAGICTGAKHPQACFHYWSAIVVANNPHFNPVTCSSEVRPRNFLQGATAVKQWSEKHNKSWLPWMRRPAARCQRDEWPPNLFWQDDPGQLIRYDVSTNLLSRLMPKRRMLWDSKLVATLASILIRHY